MNEQDIYELLKDTYGITYDYCSNRQNCNGCMFKTSGKTNCLGEKFYKILCEVKKNMKGKDDK